MKNEIITKAAKGYSSVSTWINCSIAMKYYIKYAPYFIY